MRGRANPVGRVIVAGVATLAMTLLLATSPTGETAQPLAIPTDKEIADSPIYKPAPEYPDRAMLANIEGNVTLSVTIAPDGHVAEVEVISAEPSGWFEEAALEAIKTWKYRPPRKVVTFQVAIEFTLP